MTKMIDYFKKDRFALAMMQARLDGVNSTTLQKRLDKLYACFEEARMHLDIIIEEIEQNKNRISRGIMSNTILRRE